MNAQPDRYCGLLGKIAFDADMARAGVSREEADQKWLERFPVTPSNVIYGIEFGKGKR